VHAGLLDYRPLLSQPPGEARQNSPPIMISNITQAFAKFNEKFDPTFSLVGQGAWETKFPESYFVTSLSGL
jgi:hypothetical protein